MITLRLFHQADPFRLVEERTLQDGVLTIGRDPTADWYIPDPDSELSRHHCVLSCESDQLTLKDTSSNGVYLGVERRRAPRDEDVTLKGGDTFHLGSYMIVTEANHVQPAPANDIGPPTNLNAIDAPFHQPMLRDVKLTADAFAVMSDWSTPADDQCAPTAPSTSNTELLDAFCAGARLDPSAFAGEDPVEVMRRVGAIYQQVVLGLGDLMSERTSLKAEYRMNRTTVRPSENNPFKWAPTQRVAVDLLRARNEGFLSGPAAFKASFEDLKKHLLGLAAGSRAAIAETLERLRAETIEDDVKGQSLLFVSKSEACWRAFQKRHEDLAADARDSSQSCINQAFRKGYERQLRALDEIGTCA